MTKKKPRYVEPYTLNAAISFLGDFSDRLNDVLREFFQDTEVWPAISADIYPAINNFYAEIKTNPDRKETQKQRDDQRELIECMKELSVRMHHVYTPMPLLTIARSKYKPLQGAEQTLDNELKSLLIRLNQVRSLYESIEIPTPAKTNPGRPERDRLLLILGLIFDKFAEDDESYQRTLAEDVARERREFIQMICAAFNLEITLPRNL